MVDRKTMNLVNYSPYYEICREERNYVAILFAALYIPGNIEKFIAFLLKERIPKGQLGGEWCIYYEYSYLRDWWNTLGCSEKANEIKIQMIRKHLKKEVVNKLLKGSVKEINQRIVSGKVSSTYLQYPGKWSIHKLNSIINNADDFLETCKFKWAFNM